LRVRRHRSDDFLKCPHRPHGCGRPPALSIAARNSLEHPPAKRRTSIATTRARPGALLPAG
jgi:hypothetical protein